LKQREKILYYFAFCAIIADVEKPLLIDNHYYLYFYTVNQLQLVKEDKPQ